MTDTYTTIRRDESSEQSEKAQNEARVQEREMYFQSLNMVRLLRYAFPPGENQADQPQKTKQLLLQYQRVSNLSATRCIELLMQLYICH